MDDTPSQLLSRAADLIRDTAALAVAPPWSQCGRSVMHGPDEEHEVALTPTTRTAAWVTLMAPDKAEHIEAWLRQVQHRAARSEESARLLGWPSPVYREDVGPALAFARMILVEEVTEDVR